MKHSEKFVNSAQELTVIALSVSELLAKRQQQQDSLFEAFKASLLSAVNGQSEDWQIVVSEGIPLLDDYTRKTLLSAKTADGQKARSVFDTSKGWRVKPTRITPEALPNTVTLIENLANPFRPEKETKPEKSEFEKMVTALKAVSNRLDKGTQAASSLMADSLAEWLKFYQDLVNQDKQAGE